MRRPRVLFLGLDAADPGLVRAWARDGTLPTAARLLERGASARTANPLGLYVGAVWPSFVTGLPAAEHGRYCYEQLRPGTYRDRVVGPDDVRGVGVARRLSDAGLRVASIDVPKTSPDPAVRGVTVCDWGAHDGDPQGLRASPPEAAAAVLAEIGPDPLGPCDEVRRTPEAYRAFRDALVERIARRERWVARRLAEGYDAVLAVFSEAHCVGHQAWHLHDPAHERHDAALAAAVGDPMRDVYAALDGAIGRLLSAAGDGVRSLVLFSHGMGPHHDGGLAFDALLAALEPSLPAGRAPALRARLARRLDVRTTRRWSRSLAKRVGFGLPIPSARSARLCFAVPNNDAWAGVRINLVGREPCGRVRPGADAERTLTALAERLAEVRSPAGEPVFARIVRASERHGGRAQGELPDLLAEWRRERPIDALVHPLAGRVEGRYRGMRTGDHTDEGLVIAVGDGVPAGEHGAPVAVEDVHAALLSLAGVEAGRPVGFPAARALTGSDAAPRPATARK